MAAGSAMRQGRLAAGVAALLTVVTAATVLASAPDVVRFVVAAFALAALAAVVGQSIEQVGERLGPGPTGLLQSSLGNLPELLVGIFALRAGLAHVVQAALVGSVLANLLLVLGVAFLSGGVRHGAQRFEPEAPRMLVTLLALAVGAMLVPTLAVRLHTPATSHADALSDVVAIVLLLVYATSIPFWLSGGPEAGTGGGRPAEASDRRGTSPAPEARGPRLGRPWARDLAVPLALLAAAAVASALVSDWFVAALTPATRTLGISQVFTGLVIVAIASNAVENVAGVRFAWKARADYAISTILNSPLQIALFLTPLLVLISPLVGPVQLTMVLPSLLVAALAIAVGVVTVVVYDGEYSWLEGVALIALYAVTAGALWWG